MTDARIPPPHKHEFYYEPEPAHPIYLRSGVTYTVVRTEVTDETWEDGPTFRHYVEEKAERERRLEAQDAAADIDLAERAGTHD